MGWISDRKMQTGSGIGGRRKGRVYAKDGAPLRRVVALRQHGSMFVPDRVMLECGHEGDSWGGVRARCVECKRALYTKSE